MTAAGEVREYESRLPRRSYRDGARVRKETLANLSALPDAAVDAVEAVLKGATLVDSRQAVAVGRSRGHGHVAWSPGRPGGSACRPCSARRARSGTWPARWWSRG